jgi:hypothetical protein
MLFVLLKLALKDTVFIKIKNPKNGKMAKSFHSWQTFSKKGQMATLKNYPSFDLKKRSAIHKIATFVL